MGRAIMHSEWGFSCSVLFWRCLFLQGMVVQRASERKDASHPIPFEKIQTRPLGAMHGMLLGLRGLGINNMSVVFPGKNYLGRYVCPPLVHSCIQFNSIHWTPSILPKSASSSPPSFLDEYLPTLFKNHPSRFRFRFPSQKQTDRTIDTPYPEQNKDNEMSFHSFLLRSQFPIHPIPSHPIATLLDPTHSSHVIIPLQLTLPIPRHPTPMSPSPYLPLVNRKKKN